MDPIETVVHDILACFTHVESRDGIEATAPLSNTPGYQKVVEAAVKRIQKLIVERGGAV